MKINPKKSIELDTQARGQKPVAAWALMLFFFLSFGASSRSIRSGSSQAIFGVALDPTNCSWIDCLNHSSLKRYSQGGQDGILESIFDNIGGPTNRFFAEVGFGYSGVVTNDTFASIGLNTANLKLTKGWSGVYFDALLENAEFGVVKALMMEDNIAQHFRAAGVPLDVDYVSIDVDSVDLWLLNGLLNASSSPYRPRVISVEFNINYAADMFISMDKTWHAWTGRSVYVASAAALNYIAESRGYVAVHLMASGLDMFFVRGDVLAASCAQPPLFASIAAGKIPCQMHRPCLEEDLARLVHLPSLLAYPERPQYANAMARREVARLEGDFGVKMCNVGASHSTAP